ncbi:hypothetical protein AVEN_167492-1 [Araneus ventricosus]|uniref:Uncharacterized protein n=1 Tax=Araneus ventricosus TaxID=182803 RepID=A0A4Y2UKH5_ARAVE|nr:hypothetical protein AVEN_167492-1 [Araneus ventricosus]
MSNSLVYCFVSYLIIRAVRSPETAYSHETTRDQTSNELAESEERKEAACRENDPVLYNRRGLKGSRGATVETITQVDRQRELITSWLSPMMKRRGSACLWLVKLFVTRINHGNLTIRPRLRGHGQRGFKVGIWKTKGDSKIRDSRRVARDEVEFGA